MVGRQNEKKVVGSAQMRRVGRGAPNTGFFFFIWPNCKSKNSVYWLSHIPAHPPARNCIDANWVGVNSLDIFYFI